MLDDRQAIIDEINTNLMEIVEKMNLAKEKGITTEFSLVLGGNQYQLNVKYTTELYATGFRPSSIQRAIPGDMRPF